ncbi:hypothetical protein QBC34DRAFT_441311 [Podospora aff. communis PSN243]|uniref:Uncharacterized protein n=1 Tax=Podospora aff. communis PSN243 TaxID=3040156 RepID=A0AAV9GCW2_9PEZI|nr:hypothetical protein QBC34DRAFT_441311 [Podospora aff. communis PSN243]
MDQLPPDYFVSSLQFTKHVYQDVYPAIDPTNPELSLADKVAIITGASRGIGAKGIIPAFARAGVKGIVLVGTNIDALQAVEKEVKEVNSTIKTLAVATNIADAKSVDELFAKVKDTFGHADILINNAGINSGGGVIHEEKPEEWWQNFEVNTKGAFLLIQNFIKSLPTLSTPGTIVNLVTAGAWGVYPQMSGYAVSKLAALQLVANVAGAYPNITAISLHPGLVDTDMLLGFFRKFNLDSPALIGGLTVWLSGERAKFLSGRTIASNWSVEDLVERKAEIEAGGLLKIDLQGKFGRAQFE